MHTVNGILDLVLLVPTAEETPKETAALFLVESTGSLPKCNRPYARE